MAVYNDPQVAALVGRVGEVPTMSGGGWPGPQHAIYKPIPGAHYRSQFRNTILAGQIAGARLWEFRNAGVGAVLMIPTRLIIKLHTFNAHPSVIENSLDVGKVLNYTVISNANASTPVTYVKHTNKMTGAPGHAQLAGCIGITTGMTGAFFTSIVGPIAQLPYVGPQTAMAGTETTPRFTTQIDVFDDVNGTHPFVLEPNEGLVIQNRVALGGAAVNAAHYYVDFSWAEVSAY